MPSRLCVISPYTAQCALLRTLLSAIPALRTCVDDLEVSTVNSFQGRDKDIVILSTVRTSLQPDSTNPIGFVGDPRRLNVGLTRARCGLITVGCVAALRQVPVWRRYIAHLTGTVPPSVVAGDFGRWGAHLPATSAVADTIAPDEDVNDAFATLACAEEPCVRPDPALPALSARSVSVVDRSLRAHSAVPTSAADEAVRALPVALSSWRSAFIKHRQLMDAVLEYMLLPRDVLLSMASPPVVCCGPDPCASLAEGVRLSGVHSLLLYSRATAGPPCG